MLAVSRDISLELDAVRRRPRGIGLRLDLTWYRAVVIAGLLASLWTTWPLWQPRQNPPLLPLFDLPQVSIGPLLVIASLAALAAPRPGAIAVTVLVAYGMAVDQTRMQPEFFSLPLLLWGSLPSKGAKLVARFHLISLWFFAGLHKLLSPDYLGDLGPRLLDALPGSIPVGLFFPAAAAIACLEIGTAALAIVPSTRRIAAGAALVFHTGNLLAFSPLAERRNEAVWPWNIVLAVSGFALIAPWNEGILTSLSLVTLPTRAIAGFLLLAPAGYYAGVVDAYPAHHLYSGATARATVYCPLGCRPEQDLNAGWTAFNVPLPPEPRLFRSVFQATCAPGDVLRVTDPYPPPWIDGKIAVEACRAGSLPMAHP